MIGFLIGGTSSGVGKTTVTMALLAFFRQRGMVVQPFKGGPDFLDTTHHTRISGRIARNLDTWMLDPNTNRTVLSEASNDADAIVVEGMMGLFDGKDGLTEAGSSAEIAKLLGLPVILVLDASKSARSIAAVVHGFESFDPGLTLAGLILNRVASERHFTMLAQAIQASCKTPILGWLPRTPEIAIAERHLGLHAASSATASEAELTRLASLIEAHFDIDRLLSLTCNIAAASIPSSPATTPIRIGVARDEAFSFYYEDNFDLLRHHGATIVPFSPIHDHSLPKDLDALYLGGGYPELHAEALSTNHSLRAAIRAFATSGAPIYAECGGMLYLGESLTTLDGKTWPMVAALALNHAMTSRLVDFGYATVTLTHDCLLGPAGKVIRGHSFHHSQRIEASGEAPATAYSVQYSLSGRHTNEGFSHNNILASYIHLHFRANPTVAQHLAQAAHSFRSTKEVPA